MCVVLLQAGRAARERAFQLALVDLLECLETDAGQVAILDATNSTQERRAKVSMSAMNDCEGRCAAVSSWAYVCCAVGHLGM